jgi:cytochrome P450
MTSTALRQIKDLPGPRRLPIVGNMFQISRPRIHQTVENWAREFGPLFQMKIGPRRLLVVADPDLLATAMKDRPDGFRRSPLTAIVSKEMGLPQGLFSAEGESWRKQRRMVMASFAPGHVRAYFPSLVKVTLRLKDRWQKAARAGNTINLQTDLMRFTVDAIAGLAFGKDVNTLQAGEDVIQRHLDRILPSVFGRALSLFPYWRFFKLKKDRDLDESVVVINALLRDYVAQARSRLQEDPTAREKPRNLLEAMIVAADQPGSGIGDAELTGNVLTMLLAGEDTTANTLAWMTYLLQQNPAALQRLQQEVRSRAPDPAAFTMELIDSLEFLDACCSETMRLKPVAPFIPLMALRDSQVGDVAVPKDGMVWGVMRHNSVSEPWFSQPLAFMPERWLSSATPALTPEAKHASLPFGSGPRMCPGRYLALLEMKMAMAMLLASFDIESVKTPDGLPPQELMAFTMNPVGLSMRLREISPAPGP